MNTELLILNKKHTDTLIEQTKTKPLETLEFNLNRQMETFSPTIESFWRMKMAYSFNFF